MRENQKICRWNGKGKQNIMKWSGMQQNRAIETQKHTFPTQSRRGQSAFLLRLAGDLLLLGLAFLFVPDSLPMLPM